MVQFYCLSVVLNMLSGLIAVFGGDASAVDSFARDNLDDDIFGDVTDGEVSSGGIFSEGSFISDKTFRLVLGVLTAFVGVIKLLPLASDGVAILGDFFPALAGIFIGLCFVIEYLSDNISMPDIIESIFVDSKKYIGFFSLGAGLLHFLLPQIILL